MGRKLLLVFSYLLCVGCLAVFLVFLAVTDGATPYPPCTCWQYLLSSFSQQLDHCIRESHFYGQTTYCLHNHQTFVQGHSQNAVSAIVLFPQVSLPLLLLPFPLKTQLWPRCFLLPTLWHCLYVSVPLSTPKCHASVMTWNKFLPDKMMGRPTGQGK